MVFRDMRAIIYARVSTEEQKLFGYSLDAQIEVCKEYCKKKGWNLVKIYKEAKSTKFEDKRPEFARAITFLKEGGADVLVAWKLDRISRSNQEFQNLVGDVGFKFVAIDDNIDLTDDKDKLKADIMIAVAEHERRNIRHRTRLGLERARAQGKRLGRPPQIPEDVKKRIIHLRKRGYTLREIAEETGIKYNTVKTICYRAGV